MPKMMTVVMLWLMCACILQRAVGDPTQQETSHPTRDPAQQQAMAAKEFAKAMHHHRHRHHGQAGTRLLRGGGTFASIAIIVWCFYRWNQRRILRRESAFSNKNGVAGYNGYALPVPLQQDDADLEDKNKDGPVMSTDEELEVVKLVDDLHDKSDDVENKGYDTRSENI